MRSKQYSASSSHRFRLQIAVKRWNLRKLSRKIETAAQEKIDRRRDRQSNQH
jgi:hypothetical protein